MGTIAEIEGITAASIASVDGNDVGDIASIEGQDYPSSVQALFDVVISSGKTVSFAMTLPSGKSISVDWDDGGGSDDYNGTGSPQTVGNTYSGSGTYNCVMTGDVDSITVLTTFTSPYNEFQGDLIPFIGDMAALDTLTVGYGHGFTDGFSGFPLAVTEITLTNGSLSGDLVDLASNTFTRLELEENHSLTISDSVMPDCSGNVYLFSTGLSASDADKVIIGMDDAGCASGGYLWMANGRTSASDTEAASLVTKGWTLDLGS